MESQKLIYLNREALLGLELDTFDVIECIERAIVAKSEGTAWSASKSSLLPGDGRYIMSTLSAADHPKIIAVKSVMVAPDNAAKGLPGVNGAIMLLDSETGALICVMDAGWVTAVRTAGLSALVAKRMANPNSSSMAFIGCGVQAHSHLDAFCELFPITEVRAVGRGKTKVQTFCDYARSKGLNTTASERADEAISDVDVIVSSITLSYETAPFLNANSLKPGAFAAITDLAIPWVPASMPAFNSIIIDDREQENTADIQMLDPNLISADLSDILLREHQLAFAPNVNSAFIFRGVAIADFAVAALAYQKSII